MMHKISVLAVLFLLTLSCFTQPTVPIIKKIPATPIPLKTLVDSASYILGYEMGQMLKNRNGDINTGIFNKGFEDAFSYKKSFLHDSATSSLMNNYMRREQLKRSAIAKKAGAVYLAANKKRKGVLTTGSGLQYEINFSGTGSKPVLSDQVRLKYTGKLINGKEFASANGTGPESMFNVNAVIAGWTEILQLMPLGSKYRVYIPAPLGYGDFGGGDDVGPGEMLIYDIELLEIVKLKN
jgi:FKBP-type peptidyl-prolyl cis-trans isomerase FklB